MNKKLGQIKNRLNLFFSQNLNELLYIIKSYIQPLTYDTIIVNRGFDVVYQVEI